jgi:lipopolysaccharide export system protein LptA
VRKLLNMGLTPARLRTSILALGGLLILAIASFLLYGRWLGRRLARDLPPGLGSTIQQSTNGFTYSESRDGHTIYTLHANKAVQYKSSGHAELHDVSITLYSAQGKPDNRIYGSAFDWDPVHGIARAMGEVQIDFQATAKNPGQGQDASGDGASEEDESRNLVHVKTSGLIFNKQTGMATTTEKLEFRLAEAAGSATGASFDSRTGVMVLTADVAFNSSLGGSPLTVRAHHAQFDRNSRLLYLLKDVADYADAQSSSDQATVSFRADGSAYQVLAEGHVVLSGNEGRQLNSNRAQVDLGPKSEPQRAVLDHGLVYVADSAARVLHGSASSATLLFGPQVTLRHAQMNTTVSVVDEEKMPPVDSARQAKNPPVANSRQVQASKVDIDFVSGADRRPEAQHILATGDARLNVRTLYAKTPPEETTVRGDELFATLGAGENLASLRGTGHTSLNSLSSSGSTQNSTGDNLLLTFASSPAKAQAKLAKGKAGAPAPQPAAQLESAVQTGNVTLVEQGAPGPDTPSEAATKAITKATAQRAAYDADTQVMELTGNPRLQQATGELAAARIVMQRATGNADATGGVKATYRQAAQQPNQKTNQPAAQSQGVGFTGNGPLHVVADHAHLDHGKDMSIFYGAATGPARLWQGSDSVSAMVLELSRKQGTLSAHGGPNAAHDAPNAGAEVTGVSAVFTSMPAHPAAGAKPPASGARPAAGTSVVRIQSRTLVYAESDHKAVFSGAVTAQTASGQLRAGFLDVYFTAPPPVATPQNNQTEQATQRVSKMVAHGVVELQQPGRRGTGEELTYTATDGRFVLTGTNAAPPRLSDEVHGSITGNSLIFNDRDDSVVVSGGASKVTTQTHVAK